jgi:hypothetical protein
LLAARALDAGELVMTSEPFACVFAYYCLYSHINTQHIHTHIHIYIHKHTIAGGRGLLAARALDAGELVMTSEPFACAVHDKYSEDVCHGCFREYVCACRYDVSWLFS